MQTTKLNLVLSAPDVPVPDTAYTGGFTGSTGGAISNTTAIIATIAILTILAIIVAIILHTLNKNTLNKHGLNKKLRKSNLIVFSFIMLGFAASILTPLLTTKANTNNTYAADSYATIEVPEQVDMNGEIEDTTFTYSKLTITKPDATNYGYELYILANEANDDLNFVPKTETNETVITSIEQEGTLTANTYGFTLEQDAKAEDEVWHPLTDIEDLLASYDTATTANNTTDVYFGVLTDNTVLPDTYTLDIDFYAITTLATIDNLTYMQEFKSISEADLANVKDSMVLEQQYQLKDIRDEKSYYIAKLKDNNIWMTQNLDHDIVTTEDFYTPDNTDIPAKWTAGTATYATNNTTWDNSNTTIESYDPGDLCQYIDYGTASGFDDCSGYYESAEVLHRHIGNYYNWTAAVAMNDSSIYADYQYQGGSVNHSICPAGWTIPSNNIYNNLVSSLSLTGGVGGNVFLEPIYFAFAGRRSNPYGTTGTFYSTENGYYWTNDFKSGSTSVAYNFFLRYEVNTVESYKESFRSQGLSVRCIAR